MPIASAVGMPLGGTSLTVLVSLCVFTTEACAVGAEESDPDAASSMRLPASESASNSPAHRPSSERAVASKDDPLAGTDTAAHAEGLRGPMAVDLSDLASLRSAARSNAFTELEPPIAHDAVEPFGSNPCDPQRYEVVGDVVLPIPCDPFYFDTGDPPLRPLVRQEDSGSQPGRAP